MENEGSGIDLSPIGVADDYHRTEQIPQSSSDDIIPTNNTSEQDNVHMFSHHDLFTRFRTNQTNGLSLDQVIQFQKQHGENKLTPPKKPNYILILLGQLFTGFNIFLWVAALFAFLAWKPFGEPAPQIANLALGIVLCLIIFTNAILDSHQVIKSTKIVASFSNLLPTLATVRRDGVEQQIIAEKLVSGDIVLVRMEDKLPADLRIITCDGLNVRFYENQFYLKIFSFR